MERVLTSLIARIWAIDRLFYMRYNVGEIKNQEEDLKIERDYTRLVLKGKLENRSMGRKRHRIPLTDKNRITCDDMRLLLVLGAKPKTERGRNLMIEHEQKHQEKGTLCFDAQDALDIYLDPNDPENRRKIGEIFGPCEWPK